MKVSAFDTLVNGVAATLKGGATVSDVAGIFANAGAREELLHAARRVASGGVVDTAQLRTIAFDPAVHGGVGLLDEGGA